jgi:pimeloyl-ACP methyl ester carboxylesterase
MGGGSGVATSVILLHGGGTSARQWDLVTARMTASVAALDVPGRGDRPADVETLTLTRALDSLAADAGGAGGGPVVLVAHSSGGLLVPGLVDRLGGRVRRVVLIAASVPPDGGSGLDCMKSRHADRVKATIQAARRGEGRAVTPADPPPAERARTAWGTAMTDEQIAFTIHPSRWVSDTYNFYDQPLDFSAVRKLPCYYVLTVHDTAVPPALQQVMASRVTGSVWPVASGHLPHVTLPDMIAALCDGVALDTDRALAG